jgi:hypothetical protein
MRKKRLYRRALRRRHSPRASDEPFVSIIALAREKRNTNRLLAIGAKRAYNASRRMNKKMANKKILLRNVPPALHDAAKTIAAHLGISLERLILEAVHAHCLRIAHERNITEHVISQIEKGRPR